MVNEVRPTDIAPEERQRLEAEERARAEAAKPAIPAEIAEELRVEEEERARLSAIDYTPKFTVDVTPQDPILTSTQITAPAVVPEEFIEKPKPFEIKDTLTGTIIANIIPKAQEDIEIITETIKDNKAIQAVKEFLDPAKWKEEQDYQDELDKAIRETEDFNKIADILNKNSEQLEEESETLDFDLIENYNTEVDALNAFADEINDRSEKLDEQITDLNNKTAQLTAEGETLNLTDGNAVNAYNEKVNELNDLQASLDPSIGALNTEIRTFNVRQKKLESKEVDVVKALNEIDKHNLKVQVLNEHIGRLDIPPEIPEEPDPSLFGFANKVGSGIAKEYVEAVETGKDVAQVVGNVADVTTEIFVPGVYTAKHWNEMSDGERRFNLAVDALFFVPYASLATRAVSKVARVSRRVSFIQKVNALARGEIKHLRSLRRAIGNTPAENLIKVVRLQRKYIKQLGKLDDIKAKKVPTEALDAKAILDIDIVTQTKKLVTLEAKAPKPPTVPKGELTALQRSRIATQKAAVIKHRREVLKQVSVINKLKEKAPRLTALQKAKQVAQKAAIKRQSGKIISQTKKTFDTERRLRKAAEIYSNSLVAKPSARLLKRAENIRKKLLKLEEKLKGINRQLMVTKGKRQRASLIAKKKGINEEITVLRKQALTTVKGAEISPGVPVGSQFFTNLPEQIVENTRLAFQGLTTNQKGIIGQLKKDITTAKRSLNAAKEKFPTAPGKWADLQADLLEFEARLAVLQKTGSIKLIARLKDLKERIIGSEWALQQKGLSKRFRVEFENTVERGTHNKLIALRDEIRSGEFALKQEGLSDRVKEAFRIQLEADKKAVITLNREADKLIKSMQLEAVPKPFTGTGGRGGLVTDVGVKPKKKAPVIGGVKTAGQTSLNTALFAVAGVYPGLTREIEIETKKITNPVVRSVVQTDILRAIREGIKAMEDARTKEMPITKSLISEKVKESLETSLKTRVTAEVKEGLRAITQPITKTITTTLIKTTIQIKPRLKLLPRLALASARKKLPDKLKRKGGMIAWKQGFIWIIVKYPYKRQSDISYSKTKPAGAFIVDGIGSAYKTIQILTGTPPDQLFVNIGFIQASVTRSNGGLKLDFKRIKSKIKPKQVVKSVR